MPAPYRVIRVKNDGNPVADAAYSEALHRVRSLWGSPMHAESGDPELAAHEQVWAVRGAHRASRQAGHGAVDNTMYELWMDTSTLKAMSTMVRLEPDPVARPPYCRFVWHTCFKWILSWL